MTRARIAAVALFVVYLFGSAQPARADIEVRIDKAAQRMAVIVDGVLPGIDGPTVIRIQLGADALCGLLP